MGVPPPPPALFGHRSKYVVKDVIHQVFKTILQLKAIQQSTAPRLTFCQKNLEFVANNAVVTRYWELSQPTPTLTCYFCFCFFFVAASSTGCYPRWRSFFVNRVPYCYFPISKKYLTWKEAEDFCREKKSHLASINSKEEQSFIRTITSSSVWIGLRKKQEWEWSDGYE